MGGTFCALGHSLKLPSCSRPISLDGVRKRCTIPRVEVVEPASSAAKVLVAAAGSMQVASVDGAVVGVRRRSSRWTNSSCVDSICVTPYCQLVNGEWLSLGRFDYPA